jgi:hypothetical protein
MNILTKAALAAALAATSLVSAAALARDNTPSVSIPADQISFFPTGVKTAAGELQAGPAYGDLQHGKHGTFIRMPAHFVSPLHTHTQDYYAVVVAGVGANGRPGEPDIKLPVGSYWFQKGGEPHITKCVSSTDCLFFISQPDKFDYVPVK